MLLLAEDGDELVLAAWKGCEAVAATIPKENQVGEGERVVRGGRRKTADAGSHVCWVEQLSSPSQQHMLRTPLLFLPLFPLTSCPS